MRHKRILILGGTSDARALAAQLLQAGYDTTTSLAGDTRNPEMPAGTVRRGGFGGVDGLIDHLLEQRFDALVDATHPFALRISSHAVAAARTAKVPLLRFERPPWQAEPGDIWIEAENIDAAVAALPAQSRVLLTIGRKEVMAFLSRQDLSGVIRTIEPPPVPPGPNWRLLVDRPPFSLESERELMAHEHISHLVSKNAGGEQTRAKLVAARMLGIAVVMVSRPRKPDAATVTDIDAVEDWLRALPA